MCPFSRQENGDRGGFTLLELMIVLVLLAFLVAIAWPLLRKPLQRSLTQQAARQLREDLARARLNAIESGRTLAVRHEPNSGRYWIAPAEMAATDDPASLQLDEARQGSADKENGRHTNVELVIQGTLEDEVVFQDPAAAEEQPDLPPGSTLGSMLADEMAETEEVKPLVEENNGGETNWSPPVLIYPTGRAENASFVLLGPQDYMVTVTLRGLTGAVNIGPLEQRFPMEHGRQASGQSENQQPKEETQLLPEESPSEPSGPKPRGLEGVMP